MSPPGVSFVIPVRDGERTLDACLEAVLAQRYPGPIEVLAVDDRSRDRSRAILERHARAGQLQILEGSGRGAAAAINLAVRAARHPLIAQVDQDVVPSPGWTALLVAALAEPPVSEHPVCAAQGWYETDPGASLWARVMGRDLEDRYDRIGKATVDHACTGNSIYRASALLEVGLLDESMGYGYDVDLSYRLARAGHVLRFCREARSVHHWRPGLAGYVRQQYGFGYGRLDVIARHPRRLLGDDVAPAAMIAHVPLVLLAIGGLALAPIWRTGLYLAGMALGTLAAERALAGVRAWRRWRDPATLLFPAAHLLRDLAWAVALARWTARRLARMPSSPADSHSPAPP